MASFRNLATLGIKDRIRFESVAVNDFRSVLQVLTKVQPDEVYNLAGQTSVGLSFELPIETQDSIYLGTLNLLEAVRFIDKLVLGNVAVKRDWGWAPEYVEAMYLILQRDEADDFVIATGKTFSLESFVESAFSAVQLDWHKYLSIDKSLFRPSEIRVGVGDPRKAKEKLGWEARFTMEEVARMMVKDRINRKETAD